MSRTQEMPTLQPWMIAALLELEEQADRIRAGVACKECLGAGKLAVFSRIGVQWRACPTCDGSGTRK